MIIQKYKQLTVPILLVVACCLFQLLAFDYFYAHDLIVSRLNINTETIVTRIIQDVSIYVIFPTLLLARSRLIGDGLFQYRLACPKMIIVLISIYVVMLLMAKQESLINLYLWFYYFFAVAFSEEVVFRGFLFMKIFQVFNRTRQGAVLACVISGTMWGIFHAILPSFNLDTPFFVIAYSEIGGKVLISGLLSFALVKSDNILVPMLLHAMYDYLWIAVLS